MFRPKPFVSLALFAFAYHIAEQPGTRRNRSFLLPPGHGVTAAALNSLKPSNKRREVPDGRVGGLYHVVQAAPSGARSWCFRYRANGVARKLTFGPFPALSLADARALALKAAAAVASGEDPAGEKRAKVEAAKAKAAEEATPLDLVEVVVRTFVARHAKAKTRPRTAFEIQRLLARDVLPMWGKRRLSTISRADVHALLDGIVDRGAPILANRTVTVLKTLGRFAAERGIVATNPFADVRKPSAEVSRDRVLSGKEVAGLLTALDAENYPYRELITLLLLTSARRTEVAEAKWPEFDLDARTWTLPRERSKNGVERTLPLPDDVVAILRGLDRFEGTDFVFTCDGSGPVRGFPLMKQRLDKRMSAALGEPVKGWTLHDLRRSCASGMAEIGVAPHIVEAVLGHKSGIIKGVARVYNRFNYASEQRTALEAWARRVQQIRTGETSSNIVELVRR